MSARSLSSRAIIGEFFLRLDQDLAGTWIPGCLANLRPIRNRKPTNGSACRPPCASGPVVVNHAGCVPAASPFPTKYESTLEVMMDEIRRDKTGQVMIRVQEQAERANAHWASLLSTLIIAGESTACYDGQFSSTPIMPKAIAARSPTTSPTTSSPRRRRPPASCKPAFCWRRKPSWASRTTPASR